MRCIYWAQGRVMWFVSCRAAASRDVRSCAGSGPIRHTGKKLLEKHMARSKGAAYADYVRRTSGFIPWPPR
jgi:hypothetical protein